MLPPLGGLEQTLLSSLGAPGSYLLSEVLGLKPHESLNLQNKEKKVSPRLGFVCYLALSWGC